MVRGIDFGNQFTSILPNLNLEAAYSFDGSGTTVDDISRNSHTLTLHGGASRSSTSTERSGNQLNFDGDNDYGEISNLVVPTTKVRNNNYIGRSNWSHDGYFDGQIDDVVIIDEALSATEIQNLYHNSQIGIERSLSTVDKALSFDGTNDYVEIDRSVAGSFTELPKLKAPCFQTGDESS